MASSTTRKGDYAEIMVTADLLRRGFKVAKPISNDSAYDLIAIGKNDTFYRVQCKYTESNGELIRVRCRRAGADSVTYYTSKNIDWLVNYDLTTGMILYIPADFLGRPRVSIDFRLTPTQYQGPGKQLCSDFLEPPEARLASD